MKTGINTQKVSTFQELVTIPFQGEVNALCWNRKLEGDFEEIVRQFEMIESLLTIDVGQLLELQLSEQGNHARDILLSDMEALKALGASPTLNLIKHYDRDDAFPFFPTDVYSYHVDRSPIPTDTYLCTYYGASSDILSNNQAIQKVLIPEIRKELKALYDGPDDGFETFLSDYFFDLHYQAKPDAVPINLGVGHLWRLAVDHPTSNALPCIHRAPVENDGETRLLLIC